MFCCSVDKFDLSFNGNNNNNICSLKLSLFITTRPKNHLCLSCVYAFSLCILPFFSFHLFTIFCYIDHLVLFLFNFYIFLLNEI